MKNENKVRKPSKAKPRTQKSKGKSNPIFDMLDNMDEDLIAMLMQTVQDDMAFASEDVVGLFAEYLESCALGNLHEDVQADLFPDLVVELSDVKVNANGGDREAREKIQAVQDLLDNAIETHSLHPIAMMMTSKVFTDAGWAVPNSLRSAMAEALRTGPLDTQGLAGDDIVSSMREFADQVGQNPYDVHECVNSLLAGFPPEASITLLLELVAGKQAVINRAVAGFILHPDAAVAQSVAETLAASARQTPVESSMIERLVRMRPWLPQTRQTHLDATIRAMRLNALPPVQTELPKVIKCYASICDGSGTRSVFATQRAGARYQLVSVMMKSSGVAEAMVLSDLSKSEMDDIVRQMKSAVPVSETDLAGMSRMVGLAIADNFVSGTLPSFRLVEVVESLGLGPVNADSALPIEIITDLLADLPSEEKNPAAVARAHADLLESELQYQWFETGEALEDLLYPIKGSKQRVAKVMKTYLPERRHFWARQCAISALAMRGNGKTRHSPWKQLALVGRDIASDLPLDQIPLMKQIAEVSVQAFETQL
ncbi:hypothetical protein LAV84_23640 [Rhizobium sp. VS19-DR104.2]|uniref:hypothetical protein n=1 Tax=unclassified Rhizobium TaxID=2613769 RepID=UPI001CC61C4B|nr:MULTISPECIES: hypothetical protein [unclassified Rhizobium]MBZ5762253.1 hypothetical protein [Rhizobium sp. VS19-DR96]MBZ5768269.1 hypothetical protein [Rhizobium sp. VS19-DR129.2]MBZ5775859.1 hypothetical protein [Rhizobium sp. VS19-DRK62.2]MBZ5787120.1 hypothetical protein [Rhizobium sp. VS19-DR121]MBZ5804194.1 hypothetical protein [Rhizobium sp. VS19-DR181]